MPTDQQLQLALAKMLPETLIPAVTAGKFWWNGNQRQRIVGCEIINTEWLHVCWLVEQTLSDEQRDVYIISLMTDVDGTRYMNRGVSATWQQRALALCKVKGVEIV